MLKISHATHAPAPNTARIAICCLSKRTLLLLATTLWEDNGKPARQSLRIHDEVSGAKKGAPGWVRRSRLVSENCPGRSRWSPRRCPKRAHFCVSGVRGVILLTPRTRVEIRLGEKDYAAHEKNGCSIVSVTSVGKQGSFADPHDFRHGWLGTWPEVPVFIDEVPS